MRKSFLAKKVSSSTAAPAPIGEDSPFVTRLLHSLDCCHFFRGVLQNGRPFSIKCLVCILGLFTIPMGMILAWPIRKVFIPRRDSYLCKLIAFRKECVTFDDDASIASWFRKNGENCRLPSTLPIIRRKWKIPGKKAGAILSYEIVAWKSVCYAN